MIAGLLALFIIFAPIKPSIDTTNIDAEFKPYYINFYNLAVKYKIPKYHLDRLTNVKIKLIKETDESKFLDENFSELFQSEKENILAMCQYEENTVVIRESIIQGRTDYSMQELIDHELGHCVLGRMHTSRKIPYDENWIFASAMNHYISNSYIFPDKKDFLENELFTNTEEFKKLEILENKIKELKQAQMTLEQKDEIISDLIRRLTI